MNRFRVVPLLAVLALVAATRSSAQWQTDGVPVVAATNFQTQTVVIADGSGGTIIAWTDTRSGINDVYAQRLDANGVALWAVGGIPVVSQAAAQTEPTMVSDGAGGAVIAWIDYRAGNNDVYAQRIDGDGNRLWANDGVAVCTSLFQSFTPRMTTDGSGGGIVAWIENRSLGTGDDIYASRVNASGTVLWTPNGEVVCNANNIQGTPDVLSDGLDGAFILWEDLRPGTHTDVYAQHINGSGVFLWTLNGQLVCGAANNQSAPRMCADGAAGAVMVWHDARLGGTALYAQRMDYWGAPAWPVNGVPLGTASVGPEMINVTSDGAGGAIVAWRDFRNFSDWDVYAQRVDDTGYVRWKLDGIPIATGSPNQMFPRTCSDGAGGAIIAWIEDRFIPAEYEVYAQRVTAGGTAIWDTGGRPVCTATDMQLLSNIMADGAGGAVVVWGDQRTHPADDIYAQRVEPRYGYWGHPEPRMSSVDDIPGDQGGRVKVNWLASDWDDYLLRTITHYSVWRATDIVAAADSPAARAAAAPGLTLVDPATIGPDFAGPAYVIAPGPTGTAYYWEFVGTQNASSAQGYSYSAPTRANGQAHYFQVMSHTWDSFVYWISDAGFGISLDNLAPAAPLNLAAQGAVDDVILTWQVVGDDDFVHYTVYRGIYPTVQPAPENLIATTTDPTFTDAGKAADGYFYVVTATDVNGNEGVPSNVASLSPITGVGDAPPLDALRVLQNSPNPFSTSTMLRVGLPRASAVSLDVFDIAGRRVASRVLGSMERGWTTVALDARDDAGRLLPSGVYFCRVRGAGETVTSKMVIAR